MTISDELPHLGRRNPFPAILLLAAVFACELNVGSVLAPLAVTKSPQRLWYYGVAAWLLVVQSLVLVAILFGQWRRIVRMRSLNSRFVWPLCVVGAVLSIACVAFEWVGGSSRLDSVSFLWDQPTGGAVGAGVLLLLGWAACHDSFTRATGRVNRRNRL